MSPKMSRKMSGKMSAKTKSIGLSDPRRWQESGADRHALESRAAALVEAAKPSPPLTPRGLGRIRDEVVARRRAKAAPRSTWVYVLVGLLILCATTVGGATIAWRRYVAPSRPKTLPADPEVESHATRRSLRPPARAPHVGEVPPAPTDPGPTSADAPSAPATTPADHPEPKRPSRRAQSFALAETPPAAGADRVGPPPMALPQASGSEAALLAEALVALRQRQDPRGALTFLDRHAREFPRGVLEIEALRTRVEAMIQLGDMKAALRLLDGASARDVLGAELWLTRAELRAGAGRFREALADFTDLAEGRGGPLGTGGDERLLYGRAICLGNLGQSARAREALLSYRERFPKGRFAEEVDRLLGEPSPSPRP